MKSVWASCGRSRVMVGVMWAAWHDAMLCLCMDVFHAAPEQPYSCSRVVFRALSALQLCELASCQGAGDLKLGMTLALVSSCASACIVVVWTARLVW